jgi:beta-glucosidase
MPNPPSNGFPDGFLWGAATAAHQVEGQNTNSDFWILENVTPTLFAEPSGDGCDHYHRYPDDIKLLAGLGLNTYRFSIEWARIEPERGLFSTEALDHYRRMLAACHQHNITPMVTFYHFTSPSWFAAMGGWEHKSAADVFLRYCERASEHLGDLIGSAATFNEPNIPSLLRWQRNSKIPLGVVIGMVQGAARDVGSDRFSPFLLGNPETLRDVMIAAHHRALAALKSGPGDYPVGITVALQDEQAVGAESKRDEKRAEVYEPWLAAAAESDFLGVQTYSRTRVGEDGDLPPERGIELTQMGYEFWPQALEQTIRYAHEKAKVPIYVTESGISTEDDNRRVDFIRSSLEGVRNCLADGIDIRGYIHWSLLDNFEWLEGYRPKFGLIAVNRSTQERTVKPSAQYLGDIARRNCL